MSRLTRITAIALATTLVAGCASKAPKELPPEPGPAVSTQTAQPTLQGPAPGSQADFLAAMMGRDTIYFDTDKFNIDETDAAALRTQAGWLARYPAKRATIEGHCDERGTRDYNIALGQRRAVAAKDYLVSLGIDAARLSTISYGKERPVALGSTEEAWAKNRRAVTVTID
ncbi:MAG: peptidoglycan-associated lipoprotein Pal [Sphingomonadales bacterium]|nr:peptidoglycan-associated lipoprotein Pal [Sphingomonadales bacterium]